MKVMTEKLLNKDIAAQVRKLFDGLKQPVQVLFFGSQADGDYSEQTQQLLEEVTALSDHLHLKTYDLDQDAAVAQQYKVDYAPGVVIAGLDGEQVVDYGVRFAGIPAGHEFSALIHVLLLVSGRDSGLEPKTRKFLSDLKQPVLLQVFSTPT
jgi:alkyl hydroperoxide reductase subunit AhpF